MTATSSSQSSGLLSPVTFLELVDLVLLEIERERLDPGGASQRIIEVRPDDCVLQILAGPGSGKTEMLIWRILYELFVVGTDSHRILVTTFTNRAATELSVRVVERVDALAELARSLGIEVRDPKIHDLRIGTIHSLSDSLLAEFDSEYMARGTQVIDDIEARVRLTQIQHYALNKPRNSGEPRVIDELRSIGPLVALFRAPWEQSSSWPARGFAIVTWLQDLLNQHTETWLPRCGTNGNPNGVELVHQFPNVTENLNTLAERWWSYLDDSNVLDFATIQKRFLDGQAEVEPHLDHVFIDEFQDTNPIQFAIHTGWLANGSTRVTVVGDDDQSIYRFRGSDISCFTELRRACDEQRVSFRMEKLEENWRSTRSIVGFGEAFRQTSALADVSMPKSMTAPESAEPGVPPRLIEGSWAAVSEMVAKELRALGVGRQPQSGTAAPTAAVLLFSTSEKETRRGPTPALDLRRAMEAEGLRVYNPRNKTAGRKGSPIYELAGLLSYFFDPVTPANVGKGGRSVEVWASNNKADYANAAPTAPPPFPITQDHASIQKGYLKSDGKVGSPGAVTEPLLNYLDQIRDNLVEAVEAHSRDNASPVRLTLSGLVARILSFPHFRDVGFTTELFREALFTHLLESHIAPTRLRRASMDQPLSPTRDAQGRVVWPNQVWQFLSVLGPLVALYDLDDEEIDAFAEHAVAMMTFHQAKGLEFEHVYVGLTGRDAAPHAVLRTMLFSGGTPDYRLDGGGQPVTSDSTVARLAAADRDREVYVATTRAQSRLTIIHDPDDTRPLTSLNPSLAALFRDLPERALGEDGLRERSFGL